MQRFDYLVLGSGIAGLSFALKAAVDGRVAVITKKDRAESNTNYAQGGIAAVTSKEDSVELHVKDTLDAGAGLCREAAVRTIIEEGPARIAELIELGMKFTERVIPRSDGLRELDLGKEGGHSKRRILHAKDITGREVERALLAAVAEQPNIQVFENHLAIDLITSQKLGLPGANRCHGVYALDKATGTVETFAAPVTALAFSNDGRALAAGDEDGGVCVWDLAAAARRGRLGAGQAHRGAVWSLSWSFGSAGGAVSGGSGGGNVLASGGADDALRLWDCSGSSSSSAATAAGGGAGGRNAAPASASAAVPRLTKIADFGTKATPVLCVRFTPRNLLLGAGALTLGRG